MRSEQILMQILRNPISDVYKRQSNIRRAGEQIMAHLYNEETIAQAINTKWAGKTVRFAIETDSTNSWIKRLAKDRKVLRTKQHRQRQRQPYPAEGHGRQLPMAQSAAKDAGGGSQPYLPYPEIGRAHV